MRGFLSLFVALTLTAFALPAGAETDSPEEQEARRARRGASLRVGGWNVVDLQEPEDVDESHWPLLEGSFQKGLDRHLAWVNNLSFWRRSQSSTTSGGITGGGGTEEVQSYVIPLFTALRFHPLTGPEDRVEPFLDGGAGFALGIEDVSTTGSGGLLGATGSGTSLATGFGFRFGGGVDAWLSPVFGLSAQARYQWVKFSQELSDEQTFKGFAFDVGLTYRFQY